MLLRLGQYAMVEWENKASEIVNALRAHLRIPAHVACQAGHPKCRLVMMNLGRLRSAHVQSGQ